MATTVYQPGDDLALTLFDTQRRPNTKTLLTFARSHCEMDEDRNRLALAKVAHGVPIVQQEMALHMAHMAYMAHTPSFKEIGQMMLAQWAQGMGTSLQS